MGFFDENPATQGGDFVSSEEKDELIASGQAFEIVGVNVGGSQWGEKFYVTVLLDGETRTISFGKGGDSPVESRDRMLDAAVRWFADGKAPFSVVLTRKGRSIILEQAEANAEA